MRLADDLRREVEYYGQAGAHEASVADEQDWLKTARLAGGVLESPALRMTSEKLREAR